MKIYLDLYLLISIYCSTSCCSYRSSHLRTRSTLNLDWVMARRFLLIFQLKSDWFDSVRALWRILGHFVHLIDFTKRYFDRARATFTSLWQRLVAFSYWRRSWRPQVQYPQHMLLHMHQAYHSLLPWPRGMMWSTWAAPWRWGNWISGRDCCGTCYWAMNSRVSECLGLWYCHLFWPCEREGQSYCLC